MVEHWEYINKISDPTKKAAAITKEAINQGEKLAEWLYQHEESAKDALNEAGPLMTVTTTHLSDYIPTLLLNPAETTEAIKTIFIFGYYLGRKYNDVPEAFKKP